MLYKTMILELLQQRPEMHDQLRQKRVLLQTLERYAIELKTRHDTWKELLTQAKPGRSESRNATEALEMALQEMQDRLPYGSPPNDKDPLTLDAAMAYLRLHTP